MILSKIQINNVASNTKKPDFEGLFNSYKKWTTKEKESYYENLWALIKCLIEFCECQEVQTERNVVIVDLSAMRYIGVGYLIFLNRLHAEPLCEALQSQRAYI